jgi:MYXO-CTERM domain-containing protein
MPVLERLRALSIAGVLILAGGAAVSSGCSCDAAGNPTPGFTLVFAFVAATLWARGRRRS